MTRYNKTYTALQEDWMRKQCCSWWVKRSRCHSPYSRPHPSWHWREAAGSESSCQSAVHTAANQSRRLLLSCKPVQSRKDPITHARTQTQARTHAHMLAADCGTVNELVDCDEWIGKPVPPCCYSFTCSHPMFGPLNQKRVL